MPLPCMSLRGRLSAVIAVLVSLALLVWAAILGILQPLAAQLVMVMRVHPLPSWYFPLFVLLGSFLPLSFRFVRSHDRIVTTLLDPYLILLLGQVVSEVVLVWLAGKGAGVIVGFWFTLLRVFQLHQLHAYAKPRSCIRLLLFLELVLWSINALHILCRRFLLLQ